MVSAVQNFTTTVFSRENLMEALPSKKKIITALFWGTISGISAASTGGLALIPMAILSGSAHFLVLDYAVNIISKIICCAEGLIFQSRRSYIRALIVNENGFYKFIKYALANIAMLYIMPARTINFTATFFSAFESNLIWLSLFAIQTTMTIFFSIFGDSIERIENQLENANIIRYPLFQMHLLNRYRNNNPAGLNNANNNIYDNLRFFDQTLGRLMRQARVGANNISVQSPNISIPIQEKEELYGVMKAATEDYTSRVDEEEKKSFLEDDLRCQMGLQFVAEIICLGLFEMDNQNLVNHLITYKSNTLYTIAYTSYKKLLSSSNDELEQKDIKENLKKLTYKLLNDEEIKNIRGDIKAVRTHINNFAMELIKEEKYYINLKNCFEI